jgi:hypothetical protein
MIAAAQLEEYVRAYALMALCVTMFAMYLITCIPAVAQWIVDLEPRSPPEVSKSDKI